VTSLDPQHIARFVGKRIKGMYGSPTIEAVRVAPGDVVAQAARVLPALAEHASYEGSGPEWGQWVALVEAAQLELPRSIAALHGDDALQLSGYLFETERDDLGLLAYERQVVAQLEDVELKARGENGKLAVSFNYFCTLDYGMAAVRQGEAKRALGVLAPAYAVLGMRVSDEILLAVLRHLAGETDATPVQKVCARFARNPDSTTHVARAWALDVIGDREEGLVAIARLDRQTSLADTYRRELASRYGAALAEAMAKPRPKPPKRVRTPGFVLKASRAKTTHVFAPAVPLGPACPDCGHGHRAWLSLDVTADPVLAPKLPGWTTLLATACVDCGAWMRRHDLRVDERGAVVELEVEPGNPHAPFGDDATRTITPSFLKLAKATKKLEAEPLEGHCQLGGDPAWIQDPVDVHCPSCDAKMVFVARLSSPNGFEDEPVIPGESGALYYFACGPCRRVAHIAQWT
jgi:hypothetical protein